MKQDTGLTLIELLVTLAVIGIIATVAWPTYERYQHKVTRADAVAGLEMAANEMERCGARSPDGYAKCTLNSSTSPRGKYNINIDGANTSATTFKLIASKTGGTTDPECGDFSINHLGQEAISSGDLKTCLGK